MTKTLRTVWLSAGVRFAGSPDTAAGSMPESLGTLKSASAVIGVIGGEALRLLDVVGPALMAGERIDGQADDLDAALVELGLDLGHVAEFGGADWRKVLGMREQHHPFVADPIVEADLAFGGFRCEI